jgi:hypothetical protein
VTSRPDAWRLDGVAALHSATPRLSAEQAYLLGINVTKGGSTGPARVAGAGHADTPAHGGVRRPCEFREFRAGPRRAPAALGGGRQDGDRLAVSRRPGVSTRDRRQWQACSGDEPTDDRDAPLVGRPGGSAVMLRNCFSDPCPLADPCYVANRRRPDAQDHHARLDGVSPLPRAWLQG